MSLRDDIGAVVLNYNSSQLTERCWRKLCEALSEDNIVVVDNCSDPKDVERLRKLTDEGMLLIEADWNKGYSAGNNLGIRYLIQKDIEFILIANPDVLIEKEAIAALVDELKREAAALFAGPKIIDAEGRIDVCAQTFLPWDFKAVLCSKYPLSKLNLFGIRSRYYRCERDFGANATVFSVSGCCVAFKTRYFELFRGFDEDFFLYNEEVIWGCNAASVGCYGLYVGSAVALHDHPKMPKTTKPGTVIQRMRSNLIYLEKYQHCAMFKKRLLALYYTAAYIYLSMCNPDFRSMKSQFRSTKKRTLHFSAKEGSES